MISLNYIILYETSNFIRKNYVEIEILFDKDVITHLIMLVYKKIIEMNIKNVNS